MEDNRIVDLYFQRSEQAIRETDSKYGNYCFHIAMNILTNREDAEESVSDTYMAAWNAIPPQRPSLLAAFLGKITRNLSIDRWRAQNTQKRGGGETALCLDELAQCVSGEKSIEDQAIARQTVEMLNAFLQELPEKERKVFLRRYWYMDSVGEIAEAFGFTQTRVTTMLHRTRKKLRDRMEKEELL